MGYYYEPDLEQDIEYGQPRVRLSGTDGNVFALLGKVRIAMKEYKKIDDTYNDKAMFRELQDEVFQGDYDNALRIMMSYCDVS